MSCLQCKCSCLWPAPKPEQALSPTALLHSALPVLINLTPGLLPWIICLPILIAELLGFSHMQEMHCEESAIGLCRRKVYDQTGSLEDSDELAGEQFDSLYKYYRGLYRKVTL